MLSIWKFGIIVLVSNRIEYWSNYSILFEISNIRTSLIKCSALVVSCLPWNTLHQWQNVTEYKKVRQLLSSYFSLVTYMNWFLINKALHLSMVVSKSYHAMHSKRALQLSATGRRDRLTVGVTRAVPWECWKTWSASVMAKDKSTEPRLQWSWIGHDMIWQHGRRGNWILLPWFHPVVIRKKSSWYT